MAIISTFTPTPTARKTSRFFTSRPGLDVRARHWRDVVPHRLGRMIVVATVFSRHLVWVERENSSAATCGARAIERRAARHRLRRRRLCAPPGNRSRIRHRHAALRLFLDDDAAGNLRLRHGRADASLRKRRKSPRATIRKTTSRAGFSRRRKMARRFRSRCLHRADFTPGRGRAAAALRLWGLWPRDFGEFRCTTPYRSSIAASSIALAHVRGGTDKGWRWYEEGKLAIQAQHFSDFLAVARHLIGAGYTRRAESSRKARAPAAC